MGTLNIGRVLDVGDPLDWQTTSRDGRKILTIRGMIRDTTVADRVAKAVELENQTGLVAVTYSEASEIDGYYIARDARIPRPTRTRPHATTGGLPFEVDLEMKGTHGRVELLSNYSGLLIQNNHGLTEGEVTFVHAPPVAGDDAYTSGGGTSATERTTVDGNIPVFLNVPLVDKLGSARYSCAPANYYKAAARLDVNGYTRAGLDVPMRPDSFVIGNGLVELRAEASGGVTIGDVAIRGYNGGWGSWIPFDIVWNSTTDIPKWMLFAAIRNSAESVSVKLVRDADEAPPTDNRHELTFTIRRGMPFVRCHFTYSTSVALTVDRASIDAGTAVTPTGASSAMAVRDDVNDANGNRWVVAAPKVSVTDTANGGIDMASAASHDFMLGIERGGTSADANNNADALCRQYLAELNEYVQATLR